MLYFFPILRKTPLFFPIPRAPGPSPKKGCESPVNKDSIAFTRLFSISILWLSFFLWLTAGLTCVEYLYF